MTQAKHKLNLSYFTKGPLYQFYLFTGLATQSLQLWKHRILVICTLVWLPLLILCGFEQTLYQHVDLPFIFDVDVHIRFLVSLPLLIYAEVVAYEWLNIIVNKFLENNIIVKTEKKNFHTIIQSTIQSSHSYVVEIVLILFVVLVGYYISKAYRPFNVSTWYVLNINGTEKLTLSGMWYAFISLPIFQFLLLRWYYWLILWYRLLWQISRLNLQLNSLHPDRAGGLGFLNLSIFALTPFLLAHSFLLSGMIFNRVWHVHAQLMQFQYDVIGIISLLIFLPLIPLLFFMYVLVNTKRMGTLQYGTFAQSYVSFFRKKWLDNQDKNEVMLGTPDIQSLSDLENSFEVSRKMRVIPLSWQDVVQMIILVCLPLLPLVLIIMPIEKILTQSLRLIF